VQTQFSAPPHSPESMAAHREGAETQGILGMQEYRDYREYREYRESREHKEYREQTIPGTQGA
jgi:hypothetical protein